MCLQFIPSTHRFFFPLPFCQISIKIYATEKSCCFQALYSATHTLIYKYNANYNFFPLNQETTSCCIFLPFPFLSPLSPQKRGRKVFSFLFPIHDGNFFSPPFTMGMGPRSLEEIFHGKISFIHSESCAEEKQQLSSPKSPGEQENSWANLLCPAKPQGSIPGEDRSGFGDFWRNVTEICFGGGKKKGNWSQKWGFFFPSPPYERQ